MVRTWPLTVGVPVLIRLPSGATTWILSGTSRTGSLKVTTALVGDEPMTEPCAGAVETTAACALAGLAGPRRTASSPSGAPSATASHFIVMEYGFRPEKVEVHGAIKENLTRFDLYLGQLLLDRRQRSGGTGAGRC